MKKSLKNQQSGFTLFEIMVVVVIIGILATLIIPKLTGRTDQARIAKAQNDIQTLETALDLYKLDSGIYPSTDQGLRALIEQPTSDPVPSNWRAGGYIKRLNNDPWNHPYQYLNPGDHGEIDIFSKGPTGQSGADGEKGVIGNWQ
jgi:general secretion pathway protein G